jgi:hypothetical protein
MRNGLVAAFVALVSPLAAQESGAFVVRLGRDTLAVESYTRTATELRGEQVIRAPRSAHRIYTVTYRADGTVERYELVTHNIQGGPGPLETRFTLTFEGPEAVTRSARGDSVITTRAPLAGPALPWTIHVYGVMEDIVRRARGAGGDRVAVPVVALGESAAETAWVWRTGPDSVGADFAGIGPFRIHTDARGALLGASGVGGTLQVTVERLATLDLAPFGPAFASRPLGVLSPPDSVRARIGAARIAVDYSRPAMRGRVIFGTTVPFDRVWRTGANSATLFETSADLVIGGVTVPAGKYSLYSIPGRTAWTLIVNRNTGQWGTEYDAQHDLARIAMTITALPEPIEQFRISVEPQGAGGVLAFAWERTRASVPITVP